MSETPRFFLSFVLWTGAAAAAVLALRSRRAAVVAGRVFLWLCVIPAGAVLVERAGVLAGIFGRAGVIERAYASATWIVLGIAAAAALLSLRENGEAPDALVRSPLVLRGLCLFVSLGYLAIEAGKLAHDAEMRKFFTASGLPVRAMYAVMAAEIAGAAGLLLPRVRIYAAGGLALLMLGATGTHARNGDPFSDSLDAVRMLVLLAAIILLSSRGAQREST